MFSTGCAGNGLTRTAFSSRAEGRQRAALLPPAQNLLTLSRVSPDWLESLPVGTASNDEIPIRNGPTRSSTHPRQNCRIKRGSTMAEVPHSREAFADLQRKLTGTICITIGAALEEALNVVHQPDFRPESVKETDLLRVAASAARQARHRASLRRRAQAEALGDAAESHADDRGEIGIGARSLDDAIHARRELARLAAIVRAPDWDLLTGVAAGETYDELALQHASTSAALRSRVCRLRQVVG